ncbi:MAG: hypothetical protein AAFQ61_02210 [Cyanobacteria bacterium J06626_23]
MKAATCIDYATQVNKLFDALEVSTDYNACSGLMAENVEGRLVKIFDDYDSGVYDAEQIIVELQKVVATGLGNYDKAWDAISGCQVDD